MRLRSTLPLLCLLALGLAAVLPRQASAQTGPAAIAIICELRGPDSVRFLDDRYDPAQFRLEVLLENPGTDVVTGVRVYLLSAARFTLLSSPVIMVDTLAPGQRLELTGERGFLLQPLPADQSETDTLTVFVDAAGSNGECLHPVFIEKERRPLLRLECEAPAALQFDEALNSYVPDPFPVRVRLRNAGDAVAAGCRVDFTGPPRIAPRDGIASHDVGRLLPGEAIEETWYMTPQRRDDGSMERLRFEASGRGGLSRTVTATCGSDVFIPAARTRQYVCDLELQTVTYSEATQQYLPDPFMLQAWITNVGLGIVNGMTMETVLEEGLLLAPGQSRYDTLRGTLEAGATAGPFVKSIRPLRSRSGDSLTVTVIFRDGFGNEAHCMRRIWIPAADEPQLALGCHSEVDAVSIDPQTGGYAESSFRFTAEIENSGPEPVFNVALFAFADPDGILRIDEAAKEVPVATVLTPSDGRQSAGWTVRTQASSVDRTVRLRVLGIGKNASGQYLPLVHCEVPVFVPAVGKALLECDLGTDVTGGTDNTVDFDTLHADYEGTPSVFDGARVFRVTAEIRNSGDAIAGNVSAVLLLPPPLQFEEGEAASKTVSPANIPIAGSSTASWLVRPDRVPADTLLKLELLVSTPQADPQRCSMTLRLAKALDVVRISIPKDLTGVAGSSLEVPLRISPTPGLEPRAYQLLLRFDPGIVRFEGVETGGTLTESNWRNLHARLYAERPLEEANVLRVTDSTRFTPAERVEDAVLLRLRFRVLDRGESPGDPGYIVRTPFSFLRYPSLMADGSLLRPFVLPYDETGRRTLAPVFQDGEATLTGECVLPLSASTRLFPNRPNPFNPATTIPFYLDRPTHYRISLLDASGRLVRIVDEGYGGEGMHEVTLLAEDLPSGVYFCRLDAGASRHLRRILLMK